MRNAKLFFLQSGAALAALGMLNLQVQPGETGFDTLQVGKAAVARSSGGRSGGGSFRSAPSFGGSSGRSSGSFGSGSGYSRPNYGGGPVYVPVPYGGSPYYGSYGGGGGFFPLLVLLILGGLGLGALRWFLPKMSGGGGFAAGTSEVNNNIFTVSKVQVALYAQARVLQSDLTQLSLAVDTNSSEGLMQLLQEATLALLRNTEYWTHVSAISEVAKSALEAESMVNKVSIEQRRQLSAETLVNVGGKVQRNTLKVPGAEEGPAAYIVVTFLVGTAHDRPLFDKIRSVAELQTVLEKLAALPADYLMTFELIWSPQDASDSLTDEELLTEYSDLVQI